MASDDKYDRQVRLWGHHGQKVLAFAHIILLGTASSGTETLKNLILPGVGKFTIVDDAKVCLRDCGNNFFVTQEDIGKPKAQVVCDLLAEMNPDCKGAAVEMSIDEYVTKHEGDLCKASLIVACDIDNKMALRIGSMCETTNVPLVMLRSYGMLGYVRLYKKECCIIEAKDYSTNTRDLRVNDPFPELVALADSFDIDSMEAVDYLHTPYVVFLIKCRQKWMAEHEGQMPKTFPEKNQFREMVKTFIKYPQENNIQEALATYTDCFRSTELPFELKKIVDDERCDRIMADDFWLFAAALKQFYATHNSLPLSGSVPDMVATTAAYQKVQRVYIAKAKADRDEMKALVEKIADERMMRLKSFPDWQDRLNLFCKSVSVMKMVQVIDMTSISDEIRKPTWDMSVMPAFWNESVSAPCWLLCMRAFEDLRDTNPQFGQADQDPEAEFKALREKVDTLVDSVGAGVPVEDKYVRELVRNGKSYQHCVSSYLGGLAAQEGVKLMMNQYIPLNHTFIYDGIHGAGAVFNL